MKIEIRKARKEDIKHMIKLSLEEEKYFKGKEKERIYILKNKKMHEKMVRETINKKNRILLIAEDDKKLIGFLYGSIWKNPRMKVSKKGMLDEIYITQEYRKKGVGNKLRDAFFKWVKKSGVRYIILYVEKNNKEAIEVYNKWGFKMHYLELLKKLK